VSQAGIYARLQTASYITGPTYLLNWGIPTADKVSFRAARAEAVAFTDLVLRLGRTPRGRLLAAGSSRPSRDATRESRRYLRARWLRR
jgi:hypothetical protein